MTAQDFTAMALVFGATCLVAALLGLRMGNERRDVRLMLGGGAALGGVALVLMALG